MSYIISWLENLWMNQSDDNGSLHLNCVPTLSALVDALWVSSAAYTKSSKQTYSVCVSLHKQRVRGHFYFFFGIYFSPLFSLRPCGVSACFLQGPWEGSVFTLDQEVWCGGGSSLVCHSKCLKTPMSHIYLSFKLRYLSVEPKWKKTSAYIFIHIWLTWMTMKDAHYNSKRTLSLYHLWICLYMSGRWIWLSINSKRLILLESQNQVRAYTKTSSDSIY